MNKEYSYRRIEVYTSAWSIFMSYPAFSVFGILMPTFILYVYFLGICQICTEKNDRKHLFFLIIFRDFLFKFLGAIWIICLIMSLRNVFIFKNHKIYLLKISLKTQTFSTFHIERGSFLLFCVFPQHLIVILWLRRVEGFRWLTYLKYAKECIYLCYI